MSRPLRLWGGTRPSGDQLEQRLRRELRIVRAEGYRLVHDRQGRPVRVELDRVREHIAESRDPTRWRLVPLIVPTIRRGERHPRGYRGFQYEATLTIGHRRGPYDRVAFVVGVRTEAGHEAFGSIISPTPAAQVERIRKRADLAARPNPGARAYVRPREADSQRRPPLRLPGAATALGRESNTGLLVALGGILAVAYIRQRRPDWT